MNGMVQLVVGEEDRQSLLGLMPWDMDNTLKPEQRAHHITLAFKPDADTFSSLKDAFSKGGWFQPTKVLASDNIAAVFGDVFVNGKHVLEDVHITLGGVVSPVSSNNLPDTGEVVDDTLIGGMYLSFNVVEFN